MKPSLCGLAGAEKSSVIKKRPVPSRIANLGDICGPDRAGLYLMLTAEFGNV